MGTPGAQAPGVLCPDGVRKEDGMDMDAWMEVLLDRLGPADLDAYRAAVDGMPEREALCGFVSGWGELAAWDRAELFQFCRDTVPYLGSLGPIQSSIREADVRRAVHDGAQSSCGPSGGPLPSSSRRSISWRRGTTSPAGRICSRSSRGRTGRCWLRCRRGRGRSRKAPRACWPGRRR